MSPRQICVHGHFDQPLRENPWLGEVEREDTAAPFHDWNARAAEDCYGPMMLGMRAGSDGSLIPYEGLLRRISFSFGPSLLDWLERRRPSLHRGIVAADAESAAGDGLGNAIAQPYYHVLLPWAGRRDRETLIRWGLADFSARFGRRARGMWLPEAAVDDDTLDALAAEGLEFTILSPSQVAAVRGVGVSSWTEVSGEEFDPLTPCLWISPRDPARKLAVFFLHRAMSDAVVSGEAVASAPVFAREVRRLLADDGASRLLTIASEGESYGHRHPRAERVLSMALDLLAADGIAAVNPSRFLRLFPAPREIRLRPNAPRRRQDWREPLRDALDALAGRLDAFYETEAGRLLRDPWKARDDAASLWRAGGASRASSFLAARAGRPLTAEEEGRALRLLAMQRERLAMFTSWGSCDDLSGLETIQVLQRAARALELARGLGEDAQEAFVASLARARSNGKGGRDGADVWRRLVVPTLVDLPRAAASAAILDHLDMVPRAYAALNVALGPAFRAEKAGLAGRDRTLSVRLAKAERPATREAGEWHVIVHRGDRLDFACWLVPRESGALDAAAVGERMRSLDDDAFRAEMDERFGTSRFGIDAVLGDERLELVRTLSPDGGLGAGRTAFLRRWTDALMAVRRGGTDDDALLELLRGARGLGFFPDRLPWARELEEILHSRLEALAAGEAPATLSRTLRWLETLWDAGLLSSPWRLRELHARWSARLALGGPSAEKDACRALGERLSLAQSLLEGAR